MLGLVFYICIYSYMICVWSVVMDDARVFAVTEVFLVLCLYLVFKTLQTREDTTRVPPSM